MELDKLRGVALLDDISPSQNSASPNPGQSSHQKHSSRSNEDIKTAHVANDGSLGSSIFSKQRSRKRVEFVLPRTLGKSDVFMFGTHAKAMLNEELPPIEEETEGSATHTEKSDTRLSSETMDDILFPKRRKLEEKFDEIYNERSSLREKMLSRDSLVEERKTVLEGARAVADGASQLKDQSSLASKPNEQKGSSKEHCNNIPGALSEDQKLRESNKKSLKTEGSILMEIAKRNSTSGKKIHFDVESASSSSRSGQLSGLSVEDAVRDKVGLRPRANSTDGELNLPQRGLCDERMVIQGYRWNLDHIYVHETKPKGFVNLGNTCFLNSVLQCLAYLPPFCQCLFAMSAAKKQGKNGNIQKLGQGQKITAALCNLFQNVHGFNSKSAFAESAVAPHAVVKALPTLGTCGSRNGYKFRPGRQEDAHEFLVHLLDAMNDGELRAAGINQHISGWRDRLPVPRLDETTFVHRIFGGYLRSQVRCSKCGYRSNTYDPFLDLSLEVSKKSSNSLAYAVSEFTRKETLDSANRWKCSGCKKYVCATKQLTVFRPPLSLCIQLKRFTFGGQGVRSSFGNSGWKHVKSSPAFRGGSKITKPIEFPAEMDLPLSDGRSCPYVLTGIVIHVGGSASSGHYTACVKKPGRKGTSQWFHVDDSFVEPVSERTVLKQRDAYVLFYCRKEVKLEFPPPPPRGSMSAEEAKELGRARARARADSLASEDAATLSHNEIEATYASSSLKDFAKPPHKQVALEMTKTNVHPLASPSYTSTHPSALSIKSHPSSEESASSSDHANKKAGALAVKVGALAVGAEEEVGSRRSYESDSDSEHEANGDLPVSTSQATERKLIGAARIDHVTPDMSVQDQKGKASKDDEKQLEQDSRSSSSSSTSESTDDAKLASSKPPGRKINVATCKASSANGGVCGIYETENNYLLPRKNQVAESGSKSDNDSSSSSSSSSEGGDRAEQPKTYKQLRSVDHDSERVGDSSSEPAPLVQNDTIDRATKRLPSNLSEQKSARDKESSRTRVILDRGDSRGKIEVMLGPRKWRRSWKAKTAVPGSKGKGFDLLGNLGVKTWDEDGEVEQKMQSKAQIKSDQHNRTIIVNQLEQQERSRKRKMHLDRWDSFLDQGKVSFSLLYFKHRLLRGISHAGPFYF